MDSEEASRNGMSPLEHSQNELNDDPLLTAFLPSYIKHLLIQYIRRGEGVFD